MDAWSPWPLSHTKSSKFRRCRLAFSRQYVERRSETTGIPGEVGTGFHDWALEAGAAGATDDEIALERILLRKAAVVDAPVAKALRELVRRYIARGGLPRIPDDAENVGRELDLAVTFDGEVVAWDNPKARFRCRLDLTWTEHGDLGVLRDWKTSRVIEEVDATDQMRHYAWTLAEANPDIERVHAELHYVRFAPRGIRKTKDPYDVAELQATVPEELKAIAAEMDAAASAQRWPARLGEHCSYCSYRGICPAFAKTPPPLVPIETPEQAAAAADHMLVLKTLLDDYTGALRSWALHHGGIQVADGILGFHQREKREIVNPEVAFEFFRGAEVPDKRLWEAFGMSITDAEKLAKEIHAGAPRGQKAKRIDGMISELEKMGAIRQYTGSEFRRKKPTTEEAPDDALPGDDFGPEEK